jgi:HlyD family secretion protein
MKKKKIVPVILLISAITGFSFWYFGGKSSSSQLVLRAEIEGSVYSQIAQVSGKIIKTNLELGAEINEGDLIVRLDNSDQRYALEQLQIALERKVLTLGNLLKATKREELTKARNDISIAEANFRSAQAVYKQAQYDIEHFSALYKAQGLSQSDMDKAELQKTIAEELLETAKNQVEKAKEQLSLLQKGMDANIALAELDILELESKIRQIHETIRKYEIRANCSGTVISKNYNLGSMVNAGYNLADISANKEKYAVFYVPKDKSINISFGQIFMVKSNGNEYSGEVRFIDTKSQYTPKDMQSSAMKNKVSVKVKILLPADTALKPGSRVDVVLDI